MQKLWRKNSLSILCICLSLPFTHISRIPKYFLTLDMFFITYLLHEIDCSVLNLVQLYPDSERCTVGADECCTALRPCTLLYHKQTRNGTPDVIPSHVIFFYPSVWDCDTKLQFLPVRESHGLPEQLVLKGSSGTYHVHSPGLDPHISCCFYSMKGGKGRKAFLGQHISLLHITCGKKRRYTYSSLLCHVTLNCLCTVSSVQCKYLGIS